GTEGGVFFWVFKEVYYFLNLFLGTFQSGYIIKSYTGSFGFIKQLCFRLSNIENLAACAATAAYSPHYKHPYGNHYSDKENPGKEFLAPFAPGFIIVCQIILAAPIIQFFLKAVCRSDIKFIMRTGILGSRNERRFYALAVFFFLQCFFFQKHFSHLLIVNHYAFYFTLFRSEERRVGK